jgi:type IV pilus assembly protein PilA
MKLNNLRNQVNEKGFTLIELMIVIAIIGILAAVAIPNFISYRDKAYCSAAEQDAKAIAATLADYFAIPSHTTLITMLWLRDGFGGGFAGGVARDSGLNITSSPKFTALSGENIATINGSVSALRISVEDGSTRCPEDYMTAQSDAGWDKDTSTFTKEMK